MSSESFESTVPKTTPCAECGTKEGALSRATGLPKRFPGAEYGIAGSICQRCHSRLYRRRRYAAWREAVGPSGYGHGLLGTDDAELAEIDRAKAAIRAEHLGACASGRSQPEYRGSPRAPFKPRTGRFHGGG